MRAVMTFDLIALIHRQREFSLLALDGAWRAGFEPEEIAAAIAEKHVRGDGT